MMSCFGHSHIDVAWLWTLEETERKCVRTFSNQLALMEEYPEYKFLQSQAYLYDRVKMLYPDLYERIKKAVKRGQWLVEGSMWVLDDGDAPVIDAYPISRMRPEIDDLFDLAVQDVGICVGLLRLVQGDHEFLRPDGDVDFFATMDLLVVVEVDGREAVDFEFAVITFD